MSLGMHDSGEIDQTYQVSVVLLSFGISLIGAYVGISLAEIFRVKVIDIRHGIQERSFLHYYYLFLMALSLGGVAIWSMHFIGMHAVTLHHAQSSRVSIRFNLGMSLASLIAVVLTVFGGLVIASRDRMFCKTKAEIIKLFVNDAQKLSVADIRKISATRMLVLIATRELGTLVAGGITTSAGVCIMHYIGMASMMFDGEIRWNAGIVALSVVIAMVASTAAFWILFRLLSIFPEMEWLRMASAFIMAVAVNGMHYTGMVAAEFVETASSSKEQGASYDGLSIGIVVAFFGVLVAANVVVWLLAHVGFKSSREIIHEKSQRLREAYEVIQKLTMIASTSGAYGHQNMQRVLEQFAKREEKRKQSVERKAGQAMDVLCPCLTTVLVQRGVLPDESNASSIHGGNNSISVSMAVGNENSAPRVGGGGGGGIGGSRIGNGALGTGIVSKEAALKALQAQAAGKAQAGGSVSTADPQEPRGVEMV